MGELIGRCRTSNLGAYILSLENQLIAVSGKTQAFDNVTFFSFRL